MSRIQALALPLGVLLIAFGVLVGQWPEEFASILSRDALAGDGGATAPEVSGSGVLRNPGTDGESGTETRRDTESSVEVRFMATRAEDGQPAPDALVELWRTARGQGVAFRPAKRLVTSARIPLDRQGRGTVQAPKGLGVELVARAVRNGPPTTLRLGTLVEAPQERLELVVELPPAPLEIRIVDGSGQPVPGAACALAVAGELAEFPGRVLTRTDGDGRAVLPGSARASSHLLVDAAGHGPLARRGDSFADHEGVLEVVLEEAAELAIEVMLAAGTPRQRGDSVEVAFTLNGHRSLRAAPINGKRGVAVIRGLPAGVELSATFVPDSGVPVTARPIVLTSGEQRKVTLRADAP